MSKIISKSRCLPQIKKEMESDRASVRLWSKTGKWAEQRERESSRVVMWRCWGALETAMERLTPESTAREGHWS